MGLIRSGYINLTPEDDNELTDYMWPIIREMIKTVIENNQNFIIEGGWLPRLFCSIIGKAKSGNSCPSRQSVAEQYNHDLAEWEQQISRKSQIADKQQRRPSERESILKRLHQIQAEGKQRSQPRQRKKPVGRDIQ